MNTRFHYLYRDASNYKSWGEVVFAGPPEKLEARLVAALEGGQFFIAHQVRIRELFFEEWPASSDDHCFHEFDSLEEAHSPVDDRYQRAIMDFITEIEQVAKCGWKAFDPTASAEVHRGVKCRS